MKFDICNMGAIYYSLSLLGLKVIKQIGDYLLHVGINYFYSESRFVPGRLHPPLSVCVCMCSLRTVHTQVQNKIVSANYTEQMTWETALFKELPLSPNNFVDHTAL